MPAAIEPATIQPADFTRRSFVARRLAGNGAAFTELAGAAVAARFGDGAGEIEAARHLALADLSPLPRTGFKGRGTLAWLKAQNVAGLDADNKATVQGTAEKKAQGTAEKKSQTDGALAARLAASEALILGGLDGDAGLCNRLENAWSFDGAPGAYPVMRREASFWFLVTGAQAAAMFAKLCGVDLRPHKFPDLAIAQTSVARTNAIVIRQDLIEKDIGDTLAFHVLGDSASAEFFWDCLIDAMAEFDGRPVGIDAVHALKGSR